jgi:hypothetical protein
MIHYSDNVISLSLWNTRDPSLAALLRACLAQDSNHNPDREAEINLTIGIIKLIQSMALRIHST